MANVVMTYTVMAYVAMAYTVLPYIVVAYVGMADIVMVFGTASRRAKSSNQSSRQSLG